MERLRGRFQGVANVLRFNWHLYLLSAAFSAACFLAAGYFGSSALYFIGTASLLQAAVSLAVTFYVYDRSKLYSLDWLDQLSIDPKGLLISLNAGFDETSDQIELKFPDGELRVFDFYDAATQTEVSIRRARESQERIAGTTKISTSHIPLGDKQVDAAFLFFSAHEIRDADERQRFFTELKRVLKVNGQIVLLEHLREPSNFLAYNIGAFHFLSRSAWRETFGAAGIQIADEFRITPFVSVFLLKENGPSA